MTKIWKNTLVSIAVLSVVSLVSAVLVFTLNALLPPKTSFFDRQKLEKICPADVYYQLTAEDLADKEINLNDFNKPHQGTAEILSVYRAEGGQNDGKYIVQASGAGYIQAPISMYVAYNDDATIMGVVDVSVDKTNNLWNDLVPHLEGVYSSLEGKSGDVGLGADIFAGTGATAAATMNGIARAVNIANELAVLLLQGTQKTPQEVSDTALLQKLRTLTGRDSTFIGYPFEYNETLGGFAARISAVYVSTEGDIVMESQCNAGSYGFAKLLVHVDKATATVKGVSPLQLSAYDYPDGGIFTEHLASQDELTTIFEGLNANDIASMDKYLTGSTGATQTANGIKNSVTVALMGINEFFEQWGDYLSEQELEHEEVAA